MNFWRLSCLMVVGQPLTDPVREALFQGAKRIIRDNVDFVSINERFCQGRVETKREFATLGSASGMQFTATIDSNSGTTKLSFLIPEYELHNTDYEEEEFAWFDGPPPGRAADVARKAYLN